MKAKMTIGSAFELIAHATAGNQFNKESMKAISSAVRFLKKNMGLTMIQCYIVSVVLDRVSNAVTCQDLAQHANVSPIRIMSVQQQLDDLVDRGFLSRLKDEVPGRWDMSYAASPSLINAVQYNHGLVPLDYSKIGSVEMWSILNSFLSDCDYGSLSYKYMLMNIKNMLSACEHIDFCRKVMQLNLSDENFVLLLIACNGIVNNSDTIVAESDYEDIIPRSSYLKIVSEFKSKCSELIKQNLIEAYNIDCDWFSLTNNGIEMLLGKEYLTAEERATHEEPTSTEKPELIIKPKQMFYNPEEESQIYRLTNLLEPENFNKIQDRMRKAGMRAGFCTIFHGAPGTGKTETVLQIARTTGREIIQVDLSCIKDKYVGESEKNIKAVFSNYSSQLETSDPAPILLFNEADAIFGKRHTNISSEVEQMSNAMQNIILQEMENFDGILMATTNLTDNLDSAFERRFLYKIEFRKPSAEVRKKIWLSMIPSLGEKNAITLSSRYEFSGGQIENVARRLMVEAILNGSTITGKEVVTACEEERFSTKGI